MAQQQVAAAANGLKKWLDGQPAISSIATLATAYAPVFTVITGLIGIYNFFTADAKDDARADRIVREVVAQISDMIARAERNIVAHIDSVKDYVDNTTLKLHLASIKGNSYNMQLWLTTLADSNFTNHADAMVLDCLARSNIDIAGVESCLRTALEKQDAPRAMAIYLHLRDAVDFHTRILRIADRDPPLTSDAEIVAKLTLLLSLHAEIMVVLRDNLRKAQFLGPVGENYDRLTKKLYEIPRFDSNPRREHEPPQLTRVFVYYFRGQRRAPSIDEGLFKDTSFDVVKARMEAHLEQTLPEFAGSFQALEAEQRKVLTVVQTAVTTASQRSS